MEQRVLWKDQLENANRSLDGQVGESREPRIKQINRDQLQLRIVDVERLVGQDHPVRAIWEFTLRLDLGKYYDSVQALEGLAGRPALDPRAMISVWIYAYSKGISSAREISRLCEYDPAYQWLVGLEQINYHSLSDFRVKNKESLDDLFAQILGLLSAEGLITLEQVMQDGTRIKASAGGNTFRREDKIRAHLEMARTQVRELGRQGEDEQATQRELKARERARGQMEARLELALQELEKMKGSEVRGQSIKEPRVSMTDPQARVMKQSDGGFAPSYNVQISTDAAGGIIVGAHVSNSGNDSGELTSGVAQVQKNLGRVPSCVVADGIYSTMDNIISMGKMGVDFIAPLTDKTNQRSAHMKRWGIDPAFWPDRFSYMQQDNSYRCPAGKILKYKEKVIGKGKIVYNYIGSSTDCGVCIHKKQCCPKASLGRVIRRTEYTGYVASFIAKMQSEQAKELYKKRSEVAEFTNCWIKDKIGLRQFSLRGLIKVGIETLWAAITYNIQQWIRLIWRPQFA